MLSKRIINHMEADELRNLIIHYDDLNGSQFDMNSNDIMLMKVKYGDQTIIMKVRPVNMSIKRELSYDKFIEMSGVDSFVGAARNDTTINLEFKVC